MSCAQRFLLKLVVIDSTKLYSLIQVGVVIDSTKLYSLIQVGVTFVFPQCDRVARKLQLVLSL